MGEFAALVFAGAMEFSEGTQEFGLCRVCSCWVQWGQGTLWTVVLDLLHGCPEGSTGLQMTLELKGQIPLIPFEV